MTSATMNQTHLSSSQGIQPQKIVILGSTGSIGQNALRVVRQLGPIAEVIGLSAQGQNLDLLLQQISEFQPEAVAVMDSAVATKIQKMALQSKGKALKVLSGVAGLEELATWPGTTCVLSAVVGAVGLAPLFAAIRSGKRVATANKEALVMAGDLIQKEVRAAKAILLPVDSEHSAIFQCLQGSEPSDVESLVLTASGGPFYKSQDSLENVSVAQALNHPTWKMGKKITIDSATLMNKGLEAMEASILFDIPLPKVRIVIHPQSIVHSMVAFTDGSTLAQLSWPDMCLPIQYAFTYPRRVKGPLETLDLVKAQKLEFYEPDFKRFPCLRLAIEAGTKRRTYPAVLNAANEVAVAAFLAEQIRLTDIARIVESVLSEHQPQDVTDLDTIVHIDTWARTKAKEKMK